MSHLKTVRVNHIGIFQLIDCVKHLEGPGTNNFIVSICHYDYVVLRARVVDGLVNIGEGSFAGFFADQLVAEPGLVAV